jgi:hypothetical protein
MKPTAFGKYIVGYNADKPRRDLEIMTRDRDQWKRDCEEAQRLVTELRSRLAKRLEIIEHQAGKLVNSADRPTISCPHCGAIHVQLGEKCIDGNDYGECVCSSCGRGFKWLATASLSFETEKIT